MWYKNIAGRFFGLVTKHACDRQTDGQNYDSQDHASIAVSRGKNQLSAYSETTGNSIVAPFCHTLANGSVFLASPCIMCMCTNKISRVKTHMPR